MNFIFLDIEYYIARLQTQKKGLETLRHLVWRRVNIIELSKTNRSISKATFKETIKYVP